MENLFHYNSIFGYDIATHFCTCHDSTAVVACAKLCSYQFIRIWIRAKLNFHHIWIVMEKLFMKWVAAHNGKIEALTATETLMKSCLSIQSVPLEWFILTKGILIITNIKSSFPCNVISHSNMIKQKHSYLWITGSMHLPSKWSFIFYGIYQLRMKELTPLVSWLCNRALDDERVNTAGKLTDCAVGPWSKTAYHVMFLDRILIDSRFFIRG